MRYVQLPSDRYLTKDTAGNALFHVGVVPSFRPVITDTSSVLCNERVNQRLATHIEKKIIGKRRTEGGVNRGVSEGGPGICIPLYK